MSASQSFDAHWLRFEEWRKIGHEPQAPNCLFGEVDFNISGRNCRSCEEKRREWREDRHWRM